MDKKRDEARDPRTTPTRLWELISKNPEYSRGVAKNPAAPPDLLQALRRSSDNDTLMAVVENPNTPLDALFFLAARFPRQFWKNPLLPLLLLENPEVLYERAFNSLKSLLSVGEAPAASLRWAALHASPDVRGCAALSPFLPKDLLERLSYDKEQRVLISVAQNPEATREILTRLSRDWASPYQSYAVIEAVARHPNTPPEILAELVQHGNYYIRAAAAKNPQTPPHLLDLLRRAGSDAELRHFSTPDQTLSPGDLTSLAEGGVYARLLAVRHPNTPPHVLEKLSLQQSRSIRRAITLRQDAPHRALERLAADSQYKIRLLVVRNSNAPLATLELLRRAGSSPDLMHTTARPDPSLGPEALSYLASLGPFARRLVARHPRTPPGLLEQIAEKNEVLGEIARHPSAPPALLAMLSGDDALSQALAKNPSTPPEILEKLFAKKRPEILSGLARNPSTPPHLLQMLLQEKGKKLRERVLRNPSLPYSLLEGDHLSQPRAFRQALARHPETPTTLLEELLQSGERGVWAEAFQNLRRWSLPRL